MSEPVYDEDLVNLGYLKRALTMEEETEGRISRNYGSKPTPPYYKGDTWINGTTVYTCINSREIGLYNANDWTTESGATALAESKNKTYLSEPTNYSVGDMWILQSDNDHKAGKKGDVLITTVGRTTYDEDDWVSMLGYGNIASINEVLGNIKEAIDKAQLYIANGTLTVVYTDDIPTLNRGDLWYVTEDIDDYSKGEVYRYYDDTFTEITDQDVIDALAEINQTNITADGQIHISYKDRVDITAAELGDLCVEEGITYRYNGTKWVEVYTTKLQETIRNLDTVTERVVSINTDLGEISQTVAETSATTDVLTGDIVNITEEISNLRQTQNSLIAQFEKRGGNNLFYYSLMFWDYYSGLVEYSDTEFMNNSVSGKGYLVNSGNSKQSVDVPNGTYTVSFKYKKQPGVANTSVKINSTEYVLNETEWTNFVQTVIVTTNILEFEVLCDTNNAMSIVDLLATASDTQEVWTQNPNEIRTDTVTIGKGIQVESSDVKNIFTRIDADGNRTFNKTTGQRVAEMTDKGVYAKELECEGQAQIAGLLFQKVGNQTWISSLL